jgi:hypothetical protein
MDDTTVSTESPSVDSVSDSGAGLQAEMTGDFFVDDGMGAVVDSSGNTQLNDEKKPIRTMDEFNAFKAKRSGAQQTQPTLSGKTGGAAKPVQPTNAQAFDALFEKNGQIDFSAIDNQSKRFTQFNYTSASSPKLAQSQEQAPIQPKADPAIQMKADVDAYNKELTGIYLQPFHNAWNKLVQKYGNENNIPAETRTAMEEQYAAQVEQVRTLVDAKKDELRDKMYAERDTERDFAELKKTSDATYRSVAMELLPGSPVGQHAETLDRLIFGYQVKGANGKPVLMPGYGVDIVNHLFDQANEGKTFKTQQDWIDAYNKFWVKYTSNANNVKWIAKQAFHAFDKAQEPKKRDAYRSQWDKEQQEKQKTLINNQPHATRGGNIGQVDAGTQELNDYFAAPKKNM